MAQELRSQLDSGYVLAWQFAKTVSLDEVVTLLNGVKTRIRTNTATLLTMVDNYCLLAKTTLVDIL